ncbi:hypothetical protein TrVGV298_009777 [Trichoderma virens]|nr:hypothetical protein TrVGV298_009777 [Trichoderma virens]
MPENQASSNDHHTVRPGRMMSSDGQMIYVSGIHWAAICNEIACLKENFGEDEAQDHTETTGQSQRSSEPLLLNGIRDISNVEDILSDIPSRDFANRLISRYFNSRDPSLSSTRQRFSMSISASGRTHAPPPFLG